MDRFMLFISALMRKGIELTNSEFELGTPFPFFRAGNSCALIEDRYFAENICTIMPVNYDCSLHNYPATSLFTTCTVLGQV